ncbi:uncharacterized protein VTP21DRAFT_9840 [Calcarisporiella thermophila]|uniref:uncharacterized protein n=1 Tax=Calcarisporiella thermophila TaxID=911321 RepID=UPI0037436018
MKPLLFGLLAATAASAWPIFSIPLQEPLAPLVSSETAEVVRDGYIVVLKDNIEQHRVQAHHDWVKRMHEDDPLSRVLSDPGVAAGIKHTYALDNFVGYAGHFSELTVDKIRRNEDVAYVERDSIVYASEIQRNAPWGLSRISHRPTLTFRTYNKYIYDSNAAGENITVYVIDTGVNVNHVDFEGRARWGVTIPSNDEDVDGNGHGTHVAGTIAGSRYGVSKKSKVVAVKVLRSNGSGTMSDVIAGVAWAAKKHKQEALDARRNNKRHRGSVANMSLGGGSSRALDSAVNSAVDAGVFFAVAAGNDNSDACRYSPAAAEKAITVAASTIEDERAWFSNYGKCVDVFAPGKDITSAWIGSRVATNTISGTSMASPHVAGLIAYFLSAQAENSTELFTPKTMREYLQKISTKNVLEEVPQDTYNYLIFNDAPESFYGFDYPYHY